MQELIRKVEAYDFECEAGPLTQCVYWHSLCSAIYALRAENANLRALSQGQTAFHSDEAVNEEMGRLRAENEAAAIEAISLAKSMFQCLHAEEYKRDGMTWELCDSTAGIVSQINNMVAGLLSDRASLTRQLNEAREDYSTMSCKFIDMERRALSAERALKGASHD